MKRVRVKKLQASNCQTLSTEVWFLKPLSKLPLYVEGEPLIDVTTRTPRSVWGALQQLTIEDRVYLGRQIFSLDKRCSLTLMQESFLQAAIETNRIERGSDSRTVLLWLDPKGVVKVPIWV